MWSPHLKRHIDLLERVQRRTTHIVSEPKELSYRERTKFMDFPTLGERRARRDVIINFKFSNGFDIVGLDHFFLMKKSI